MPLLRTARPVSDTIACVRARGGRRENASARAGLAPHAPGREPALVRRAENESVAPTAVCAAHPSSCGSNSTVPSFNGSAPGFFLVQTEGPLYKNLSTLNVLLLVRLMLYIVVVNSLGHAFFAS